MNTNSNKKRKRIQFYDNFEYINVYDIDDIDGIEYDDFYDCTEYDDVETEHDVEIDDIETEHDVEIDDVETEHDVETEVYGFNDITNSWHCLKCGCDMGINNPRQLCGKWYCSSNP